MDFRKQAEHIVSQMNLGEKMSQMKADSPALATP